MRDTAEVFDQHPIDADAVVEQARSILEDVTHRRLEGRLPGLGRRRQRRRRGAVRLPRRAAGRRTCRTCPGSTRTQLRAYLDAFRELILPATEVLVGNHKTLTDFLLPDWDSERPPSARELAVAAGEHGTRFVLVTGVHAAAKGTEQFIDNVLASPQGALTGEKFERFEAGFVGAGDTLSAALAALLASGARAAGRGRRGAAPSSTRAWTRASAPAWATSCPTASSGPCRRPRKARKAPPARRRPRRAAGASRRGGVARRVH